MTSVYAIVLSTCANRREAERIAERLILDGAAACVNVVEKVTSIYQWKGKLEKSNECLLVIKTRTALADRVQGTIKGFSSYECPEVLVLPVLDGSPDYLAWIDRSTVS